MGNSDVIIALVALVVAAIALIISTGQLLQQIFATADGYRKCQPSVIGEYATKTRLRWRWSEFRFETRYTTPFISTSVFLRPYRSDGDIIPITGTDTTRWKTLISERSIYAAKGSEHFDRVGWLLLLHNLHHIQGHNIKVLGFNNPDDNMPAVQMHERSWDFASPDTVKPLAASTVGAIIILGHRLGMRWLEVRPNEGIMRAESSGDSLTATVVRGLGMVFQYTSFDKQERGGVFENPFLPTQYADSLSFGIIPECEATGTPAFVAYGMGDSDLVQTISQSLRALGVSITHSDPHAPLIAQRNRWNNGLSDLPGLLCPFMLPRGFPGRVEAKVPSPFRWKQFAVSSWREGRMCLTVCLRRLVQEQQASSDQLICLWKHVDYIVQNHGGNYYGVPGLHRSEKLVDDLHDAFDMTTAYFKELNTQNPGFHTTGPDQVGIRSFYSELVATHVTVVAGFGKEANNRVDAGTARNNMGYINKPYSQDMLECSLMYVDSISQIVQGMKERGFEDERTVVDAWWTMIFRACWWQLSVQMMDPLLVPIPSYYYGSKIPVWIA